MPAALPLPIRVLVKGSSLVPWVSWMGGPRTDFTFPRALEAQLLSHGRPCDVRSTAAMSEKTSSIQRTWQREVLGFSPDVIVLVYGYYETIHLFLPRWLELHVNSLKARPRPLSTLYRRAMLRPAWILLARLQMRLDAVVPATRRRPRRVAAELETYISRVHNVGSPLVILFELLPPGEKYRTWFPGMNARIAMMNKAITETIARIGKPHVRYFRVSSVLHELNGGDLDAAIPDGSHYSPEMHRQIGIALARVIEEWAETQPHLTRRGG